MDDEVEARVESASRSFRAALVLSGALLLATVVLSLHRGLGATYTAAVTVRPPILTSCTTGNGDGRYTLTWRRGSRPGGYRFSYTHLSSSQGNLAPTSLSGGTTSFTTPSTGATSGTFEVVAIVDGVESPSATARFAGTGSGRTCTLR